MDDAPVKTSFATNNKDNGGKVSNGSTKQPLPKHSKPSTSQTSGNHSASITTTTTAAASTSKSMDLSLTLCHLLQRILIPCTLATAILLRQNLISTIYLILLLVAPILPNPTPENCINGVNGYYLKTILALSSLANLTHIISQIILLTAFNYQTSIDYCTNLGKLLNLIGIHRYNDVSFFNIIRLCCMDMFVLLITCLVLIFSNRTYRSKLSEHLTSSTTATVAGNLNETPRLHERRYTDISFALETRRSAERQQQQPPPPSSMFTSSSIMMNKKRLKREKAERLGYYINEFIFFASLCASAIIEPSIISSIYFIYFLFIGTWFAFDRPFGSGYHYFRIFITIYVGLHFSLIYFYQFELLRSFAPPQSLNARLFGLIDYLNISCLNVRDFHLNNLHFIRFLHPLVLLLLYFVSMKLIRTVLIDKKLLSHYPSTLNVKNVRQTPTTTMANIIENCDNDNHAGQQAMMNPLMMITESIHMNYAFDIGGKANDNTPLLRPNRLNRKYHSMRERADSMIETPIHINQHQHQSNSENDSFISPQRITTAKHYQAMTTSLPSSPLPPSANNDYRKQSISNQQTNSASNKFSLFCLEIMNMIKRSSYVITLIVMMTWSITYHSWLSFVLLLLSCVIWMTPNSRQTCLSSSPFLVSYAIALVIGQYIYSLNLNDKELPVTIGNSISISEIGFKKYGEFSYQPLFTKIFYTIFFWITLRQYTESLKDPINDQSYQSSLTQSFGIGGAGGGTPGGLLSPLFNIGQQQQQQPQQQQPFQQPDQQQSNFTSQSEIFDQMVKYLKEILMKYWIWIVAIMLMVMSLSGSKVVIYRIVYMALFLIFTLLLLISLKWWRKLIYPFWLFVILYSMIILIAIYTYQFNNFPYYWQYYLHIDKELQEDLGLVVYDNDAFILFQELLTPTFFIIITIIQVHFVHKEFLQSSNIDEILNRLETNDNYDNNNNDDDVDAMIVDNLNYSPGSNADNLQTQQPASNPQESIIIDSQLPQNNVNNDQKSQPPSQSELSVQTVISKHRSPSNDHRNRSASSSSSLAAANNNHNQSTMTTKSVTFVEELHVIFQKCLNKLQNLLDQWMIVFWRILEVHIMKAVYLCTILIAIRDISIMNVMFVFLTLILMLFNRFERIICLMFAIWSGILVLLKMLFQLNIAQRIDWQTDCSSQSSQSSSFLFQSDDQSPQMVDNREYIGFLKTNDIFSYIWDYILLIIILVFRQVIILRQYLYRSIDYTGEQQKLLFNNIIIFPDIDRKMADKDVTNFIKFLLNFGFYKFGVEICLLLLTITINNHNDIFSVLYCILLLTFVLFNRYECKRFWSYFVGFMSICLPYQYLMCLGIAPGFCIKYPWSSPSSSITFTVADLDWYFLPDFKHQLPKQKLYLDFLLFYFLCRQHLYFRLEHKLIKYGGSNLEAYKEYRQSNNDTSNAFDFFSFGQSLFDTFKSYFLFCFFWITLAVLFLAGTTRINLFGLGYVLGSFIFLWNGNEFYLKPIKLIFKSWKTIIGYTCMTMLLKSILQIFYVTLLRNNLCWAVQLLGLSYHYVNSNTDGNNPQAQLVDNIGSINSSITDLIQKCPTIESGLLWDSICFIFLLIQKRIFCSHYFKYLIREIKAQQFLAARGAELIHEIQAQEVAEQEIAEREVMEKIKQKMDRIKEAQQKMFANKARSIKYHKQAVKSGGYYMFEEDGTEVCDLNYNVRESLIPDPEGDEIRNIARSKGFTAFCSRIFKGENNDNITNNNNAATLVASEMTDMIGESSQDSPIISVERQKRHPDSSRPTTMTSIPFDSQSQATLKDVSFESATAIQQQPIPGTSHDQPRQQPPPDEQPQAESLPLQSESSPEQQQSTSTFMEKLNDWFIFFKTFIDSIFISTTSNLNSVSRDYRFVAKRLAVEKKCLKKIIEIQEIDAKQRKNYYDFNNDNNQTWKKKTLSKLSRLTEENLEQISRNDSSNFLNIWNNLDKNPPLSTSFSQKSSSVSINIDDVDQQQQQQQHEQPPLQQHKQEPQQQDKSFYNKHLYHVKLDTDYMHNTSIYVHFFRAIFYAILSRSEIICYITIVINQITSASILSLPLPMFAFLWGSLSVPRPSKSFWVTCITYIEIVVVLKYIFQFHFWLWIEMVKTSPFWWPRLLGIERKDNYANYDLILLLVLFFHRFMLKSLGLWDLSETEMKAYMTNAELYQTRLNEQQQQMNNDNDQPITSDDKDNNGGGGGGSKKLKNSKKKSASGGGTNGGGAGSNGGGKKGKLIQQKSNEKVETTQEDQTKKPGACQPVQANQAPQPPPPMAVAPLPPPLPDQQHLYDSDLMSLPQQQQYQQLDQDDESDEINFIYILMEIPHRIRKRFYSIVRPVYKFFHNVLHPPYRITHDVYSLMFLCDFINFFILVFGFYAFGSGYSGSEDVARFLEENKIPIGFLITLLIQFAQIIIDRAIYLRKYIYGKLVFQIIIVIFTHMWLFFVLPAMTDKGFTDKTNLPPKLWYIFKCIYFLLSAFQIRSGYPTRILGNTFCKKYNFINWYLFKMYMLIPFVYDLRMYMDWIWTDTSLVLDEWSLMEDIFVNLYQRKCELRLDEEFPEPRGRAKKRFFKYLIGGSWVVIIIALIWGPLVLFAFGRAVGEVNPPIGATFELEIGGYQPLFKMSVTDSGLVPINDQKWNKLLTSFNRNPVAQTFINGYDQQDVYLVNLNGNSTAVWGISPPSQKILQQELLSNQTMLYMKLTYYLTRKKTKTQDMDTTIYDDYFIDLDPQNDNEIRRKLADMITQQDEQQPVIIPNIFPNYLRAPEKGKPIIVNELMMQQPQQQTQQQQQQQSQQQQSSSSSSSSSPTAQSAQNSSLNYRNILLLLKKGNYDNNNFTMTSWWEIHDDCQNIDYLDPFIKDLMLQERCQYLPVIVFNDKVFIGLLAFLSGYGIIGIYTTFVFLVSRWVRGLNSESSFKVIYTRMPNVDRVLQLCLDIYLVRESREFELEEDLYAKLIFLYRSPETLIKWTKINEEINSNGNNQQQPQPQPQLQQQQPLPQQRITYEMNQ